MQKPSVAECRELQRQLLQLRWAAICSRDDQAFYARTINTGVVTNALASAASGAAATDGGGSRHSLPSRAAASSPMISTLSLLLDAASCGLAMRRRRLMNFGDGMLSLVDDVQVRVEYFPEDVASYRSRRLAISLALLYVWSFAALLFFWIYRDWTGNYSNITVPPYGSGTIHLLLSVSVVLTYVVGITIVPRHTTVGMREGALPSLVRMCMMFGGCQ